MLFAFGATALHVDLSTRGGSTGNYLKSTYEFTRTENSENHKIHRLRVIHLYEADYNLVLGVKWRDPLHHAEDNQLLNPSNYGARPGREAHDPVLIEELEMEICRASRKGLVKLDIDAAWCYDRILPVLASIISRSYGVHKNVAFINAKTLKEAL